MSVQSTEGQPPADATQGQPVVDDTSQQQTDTGQQEQQQQENTPAYQKQLDALPESVRPLVEPTFKEWDAAVSKRFQELHAPIEPWKPVIDNYDPQVVNDALALAAYMEQNPKELWEALARAYGFDGTQGQQATQQQQQQAAGQQQQQQQQQPDPDDPYAERFTKMETALGQLAQFLAGERETSQQREAQNLLDNTLKELNTKHGAFDETYVCTMIANGKSPDEAVQMYKAAVAAQAGGQQQQTQTPAAPVVVGGGGGTPSEQVDVTKLSDQQTRDLVAQRLALAAQQGNS